MPERYDTEKAPNYWWWGLVLVLIGIALWIVWMVVASARQPDINPPAGPPAATAPAAPAATGADSTP
ncbi:MAG TPA: hypothetical protein VFL93_14220 [Longimicrobiaceae bacterium]|nr:hypothetical protein [Longimicrobiaceae bacterium]